MTPYGKWIPGPPKTWTPLNEVRNFSLGKDKQVAWFVSNCDPVNDRLAYARELSKYIQVFTVK